MADDILIKVGADVKGVITAIDTTTRLENRVKKLVKAYETGRVAPEQFNDALAKISKSAGIYSKSVETYSKALQEANKAEKEAAAAAKAAKQEALALAQARKEQIAEEKKAKEEAKSAAAEVRKQAQAVREMQAALSAQKKAQEENTASLSRLRAGYDANYAAEQRRLELKRRLRQEILNGNMTLREAGAELLKYRNHVQQFNMAQQAATKNSNRFGVVTQQAGYQIGDFLVQVQSGTNFMVAFGQQATQLVGILPLLAPTGGTFLGLGAGALVALSAGLGVVIPLLTAVGAYFMRAGESADKAGEDVKALDGELKSLDQTLQDWVRTKKAAEAGITIEELIGGEGLAKAESDLASAKKSLQEVADFKDDFSALGYLLADGLTRAGQATGVLQNQEDVNAAAEKYIDAIERIEQIRQRQAEEQYQTFAEEAVQLRQQIALQEQILKTGEDSAEVRKLSLEQDISNYNRVIDQQVRNNELTENQGRLLKEQNEAYLRLVESGNKIALTLETALRLTQQITGVDLKGAFNQAAASVSTMNSRLDMTVDKIRGILGAIGSIGFDTIAIEAETKALRAGQSAGQSSVEGQMARKEAEMRQAGPLGTIERMGLVAERAALEKRMRADAELQAERDKLKPASKSGGSGNSEENPLDKLLKGLMTEREALENWRSEQLDLLQQYNETELSVIGGQAEARLRVEQEYQSKMQELRNVQLSDSATFFGALANVASAGGQKMVKAVQVFSATQALINSYVAYTEMLKDPTFVGRPFARFAAAASVLAAGLNMVQAIKGGGSGGGRGGAPSGAAATVPSAAESAAPQRVIIEGIDRNSLISGEQLSNIFEALYKENENRGFVFEVAR